jgi:hypothetical protein
MNTHPHQATASEKEAVIEDAPAEAVVDHAAQRKAAMYEKLAELGGPSEAQIDAWKQSAPGNRLRAYSLDNVRFDIVRAIGGLEFAAIQKNIPANSTNPQLEIQIEAAVLCTCWTSSTRDGKLTSIGLRTGAAGRPSSTWTLIETLSDYADPQDFQTCSVEL